MCDIKIIKLNMALKIKKTILAQARTAIIFIYYTNLKIILLRRVYSWILR